MSTNRSGSQSTPSLRLLLVDDHALFSAGMAGLLAATPRVASVVTATSVAQAVRRVQQLGADVLIVNPRIGNTSPFEVSRKLRAACPKVRMIFLDESTRELHVRVAVDVGVSGYWTRRDSIDQLRKAVHRVAGGRRSYCPATREYIVPTRRGIRFCPSSNHAALALLSRRELEVMLLLVRGMTAQEAAQAMRVAMNTVNSHRIRLMKKLKVRKTVDLVRLAQREGLLE